jgi:hypothetical protein
VFCVCVRVDSTEALSQCEFATGGHNKPLGWKAVQRVERSRSHHKAVLSCERQLLGTT